MTIYKKNTSTGGAWVDKSSLRIGQKAKIVSETNPEPSIHLDEKTGLPRIQDVCKVRFEGQNEAVKVALNRTTLNALIEAYGEDSKNWQGNTLTVSIERRDGKYFMHLVPQGYKITKDTEGYTIIIPDIPVSSNQDIPVIQDEDVDGTRMPF